MGERIITFSKQILRGERLNSAINMIKIQMAAGVTMHVKIYNQEGEPQLSTTC